MSLLHNGSEDMDRQRNDRLWAHIKKLIRLIRSEDMAVRHWSKAQHVAFSRHFKQV